MSNNGDNTVALVTGANKGIGKEIARGLAQRGHTVLLGARDEQRGKEAVAELSAEGNVRFVQLDVTDEGSVAEAAQTVQREFGRLDVLVNNSGIMPDVSIAPSKTPVATMREVYEVNVFGVVAVTNAMLPLLRRSAAGRIVNMSSGLGSHTRNSGPDRPNILHYNSSKSAVNAITIQYAKELREAGILVNAACPGLCATDMTGADVTRTAADGAQIAIKMATLDDDGPTGAYVEDDGPVPW